jgi:transposase
MIKAVVDRVLVALDVDFQRFHESTGHRSIAPERLLWASLLQAFYSVRSERQPMSARITNELCQTPVMLMSAT